MLNKDEILSKIESGAELSDDDLSAVSGGASANSSDEIYFVAEYVHHYDTSSNYAAFQIINGNVVVVVELSSDREYLMNKYNAPFIER
ncbi:MAG: hypothetical protein ACI4JZ_01680 [Oscillospiraceae bacterium]